MRRQRGAARQWRRRPTQACREAARQDVEIAELRARARARGGGAAAAEHADPRRRRCGSAGARAQQVVGGRLPGRRRSPTAAGDASWEETEQALTAALAGGGGDDAAAAAEAVSLPRLKPLLCGVDGRVKAAKLGEIAGTDAGGLVEVVGEAAANAREVERVFSIECRQKGGDGTYPLMADVDAGFVLAREARRSPS